MLPSFVVIKSFASTKLSFNLSTESMLRKLLTILSAIVYTSYLYRFQLNSKKNPKIPL
ncbi:transposase [Staphylococcus phage JPL-50]|uniref:Transposase n=1 Tax=Staphylococcus phage JPL-50 TaxID=2851077 RepID=A0A8F3C9S7_9CAUD|nr:transposase [Staphylococcus phage JPL-50]QWY14491.1 transposase [Staphylococcus phage JPL-50]